MIKTKFWITALIIFIGLLAFKNHDFDSKFGRIIHSDSKGYYAFLPATFIYQDYSYSFIEDMELKYYPEDLSFHKEFRMKQPNGTVVNKCFPGTAVFYLPFFGLAALVSWITGYPLDGYSVIFQWSIVFAHLFYLFCGLLLLSKAMSMSGIKNLRVFVSILLLVFATNVYHYVVHDFSLSHIFGLFGACALIYLCVKYKQTNHWKYIGITIPLISLLVITRPTNAMLILIFPLILNSTSIWSAIKPSILFRPKHLPFLFSGILILFLAPLLWKLQSGNWLVYSYGNEKINLLKPHFFEFLFSYLQGWWLWTPFMFFAFILGGIYFFQQSRWKGAVFCIGIMTVVYVFSSWWMWTFGFSYGQRPMIDFYPILIFGFAGYLESKKLKWSMLVFVPLIALNLLKSYQVNNGILLSGRTTKTEYWSRFFQVQKSPICEKRLPNWKELYRVKTTKRQVVDSNKVFSSSLRLKNTSKGDKFIVKASIGAKHAKSNAVIVLSNNDGTLYLPRYIQHELYSNIRQMSLLFELNIDNCSEVFCYVMNHDSDEKVTINSFEIIHYRPSKK